VSAATELLRRLSEIGASIQPAGEKLVLRAGAKPVPAELVKQLRADKTQVLAALTAPAATGDSAWWRREFTVRTLGRLFGNRTIDEAEQLAFERLIVEWHRQHGVRVPGWQCAGCGGPVGSLAWLDFDDGNRVHFDEQRACLIRYGERWRGTARRALIAMGLQPPAGTDVL
jgi:hypothetical protein